MRLKKSWAKVLSSALAVTIAFSSFGSVPMTAYAQEDEVTSENSGGEPIALANSNSDELLSVSDFTDIGSAGISSGETTNSVILNKAGGDHFAMYNGLAEKTKAFTLEADVKLEDGPSAALVIANDKNNPSDSWYGANINTTDLAGKGQFRIFGAPDSNTNLEGQSTEMWDGLDKTAIMHLKLDVKYDGTYTYTFGNKDADLKSLTGNIDNWDGGYVGILTFDTQATFSNIIFENNDNVITPGTQYKTNLKNMTAMSNATWEVQSDGLYSNALDKGDSFLYSTTRGKNFVYSTDVTFKQDTGAAALVFRRADNGNDPKNCYVVNLNPESKKCRFWRWDNNEVYDLIDEKEVPSAAKYTLKVVAIDSWISYYVNDTLVASSGDYTLQEGNKGQKTFINNGYFGLLNFNGEMVFQNTYYSEITDENTPLLNDIKITSSTGTVEEESQFVPTEPITIQYVKNDTKTVDVKVTKKYDNAEITITDEVGNKYSYGKNIPVNEGKNYITITSSVETDNSIKAELTYRVNVHRRQQDEIYYNELYRDQYHYSVKDGWANDPNGMVYYKGKYHLFYQFYDDIKWGPMHWAHATSTDMIHWTEEPIALYPDANGAMYSGCIVVDENNTSGFFDEVEENSGLVALITADGNGERIKLAYSKDEGTTWTKVDDIAADWTNDPLKPVKDFRDPKVFRWENKWFMVVAGGPLRIYSSENLKDWKCESTYADLHTECPDLYPVKATDGTLKWVLSRGGRFYKVGDFKEIDYKWTFVADNGYNASNSNEDSGIMNFGQDSYAAMTFYEKDFGTAENPTIPDIVEINWMNTWNDGYCNKVAEKTGEQFNGTFNLALKLGLTKEGDKYVLTQTPVEKYKDLREIAVIDEKNIQISTDNNLLENFKDDCYEIVSNFKPASGTEEVGFKLRTGDNEETLVIYNVEKETLSIDRSKSGIVSISNVFKNADSQPSVKKNADGTIDLHIYVDRASVEVFAKKYTVAGAEQIFPSINSLGASVFVKGEPATADITIYPMKSIWTDKKEVTKDTKPIKIGSTSLSESDINIGDKLDLSAYLLPIGIVQNITWSVDNKDIISIETDTSDKTTCHVKGLAEGEAIVTATAADNSFLKKEFKISVYENNFDTNIKEFMANGNWFINGEILSVSNTAANDSYMGTTKIPSKEYTLETELRYERGLINIFFASESTNPDGAYAVQLKDNDEIRLFRFARDGDIEIGKINGSINDNKFHKVKIDKTQNSVTVSIDGTECLTHTFDSVEDFYNDAYVGLGLWDGALEAKSFNVIAKGECTVKVDTSAVKNATVSIKKDSESFSSGDSVKGTDKLQLTITPDDNYEFSKAPEVVADNASVSKATEKDGSYTFEIHKFMGITNITVSGEASKKDTSDVTENDTKVENNVGGASLSKTDFKDIQDDIIKDVVSALEDMTENASTDEDKKAAQEAIKALKKNEAFLEMALTLVKKSGGITEKEKINQDNQIAAIKEKVQADNSGATVEVKTAITLDIELRSVCKSKANNSTIASTLVSKLTKPVTISMKLSDEIKIPKKENGVTREYYIICLHKNKDGDIEPKKIPCDYDDETNTISFPADRFSTYVLCYVDITPKSSSSSIVLNGTSTTTATPVPTATATPVPTATATSIPAATASAKPGVTGGTTPSATPTPVPSSKPSTTGTQSVTGSPVATNPPADSTATPSSEVKKGTKVTVKDISYKVTSIGSTKTVKYIGAKKDVKKIVVPASIKINGKKYKVTVIAKNAFKGNKKLTKVTIGKNVKRIGKNAFKGCKNLKKIVVKTKKLTAKKVGSNAFKGINNKAAVKAPKNKVKAYKKILKAKGAGKNIKVTK